MQQICRHAANMQKRQEICKKYAFKMQLYAQNMHKIAIT